MKGTLTPYNYPLVAEIAPQSDLRQKTRMTFQTEEQLLNAQRARYEIIRVVWESAKE